jgi:hypothetical protein
MKINSCAFVAASEVFDECPLAWNLFCNSDPNCSWGDNNRTLVTGDVIRSVLELLDLPEEEYSVIPVKSEEGCGILEVKDKKYLVFKYKEDDSRGKFWKSYNSALEMAFDGWSVDGEWTEEQRQVEKVFTRLDLLVSFGDLYIDLEN